jgi:hypothetical protein
VGGAASRIKKSEVTRLIAAVRAAGLEPQGVKIAPDGEITVMTNKIVSDDLDRELAAFEAKHAGSP